MRIDESELLQDLRVVDAHAEGEEVVVALYGGAANAGEVVRFRFGDQAERESQLRRVLRWRRAAAPLALLRYGTTTALLDERALLERATESTRKR